MGGQPLAESLPKKSLKVRALLLVCLICSLCKRIFQKDPTAGHSAHTGSPVWLQYLTSSFCQTSW